jgi:hypothetical protein
MDVMLFARSHSAPRPAGSHAWHEVAVDDDADPPLAYQKCSCGTWRVLRDGRPAWISSDAACPDSPGLPPAPHGWPYRKAYGESGLFADDQR